MASWQEYSETRGETELEMSVERQQGITWVQTPKVFEDFVRTLMGRNLSIVVIDYTALTPSRSHVCTHPGAIWILETGAHACAHAFMCACVSVRTCTS